MIVLSPCGKHLHYSVAFFQLTWVSNLVLFYWSHPFMLYILYNRFSAFASLKNLLIFSWLKSCICATSLMWTLAWYAKCHRYTVDEIYFYISIFLWAHYFILHFCNVLSSVFLSYILRYYQEVTLPRCRDCCFLIISSVVRFYPCYFILFFIINSRIK